MAIRICEGYTDPMFEEVRDQFYNHFTPDDWDYIIVGPTKWGVEMIAEKLMVCDYQIEKIGNEWFAVTYHS